MNLSRLRLESVSYLKVKMNGETNLELWSNGVEVLKKILGGRT